MPDGGAKIPKIPAARWASSKSPPRRADDGAKIPKLPAACWASSKARPSGREDPTILAASEGTEDPGTFGEATNLAKVRTSRRSRRRVVHLRRSSSLGREDSKMAQG